MEALRQPRSEGWEAMLRSPSQQTASIWPIAWQATVMWLRTATSSPASWWKTKERHSQLRKVLIRNMYYSWPLNSMEIRSTWALVQLKIWFCIYILNQPWIMFYCGTYLLKKNLYLSGPTQFKFKGSTVFLNLYEIYSTTSKCIKCKLTELKRIIRKSTIVKKYF